MGSKRSQEEEEEDSSDEEQSPPSFDMGKLHVRFYIGDFWKVNHAFWFLPVENLVTYPLLEKAVQHFHTKDMWNMADTKDTKLEAFLAEFLCWVTRLTLNPRATLKFDVGDLENELCETIFGLRIIPFFTALAHELSLEFRMSRLAGTLTLAGNDSQEWMFTPAWSYPHPSYLYDLSYVATS